MGLMLQSDVVSLGIVATYWDIELDKPMYEPYKASKKELNEMACAVQQGSVLGPLVGNIVYELL